MKIMNKIFITLCFYMTSLEVLAHNQRSLTSSIIVNVVPLIVFIVVWIILMKVFGKKTAAVNERIVESNELVAQQIKRIADHLEKDS